MFTKTAVKITDKMVKLNVISPDDREVYLFGTQQGLAYLLNIATLVVVGLLFGVFWHMLVFTLAFVPLRSFAGGYHARTPLRCYLASAAAAAFVAAMPLLIVFSARLTVILLLLLAEFIVLIAPVGNVNKPLDDLEKKIYKKRAVIICAAEVLAALIFLYLNIPVITTGVLWALFMVSILIVLEKLFGGEAHTKSEP
jgi:accessory gene regulator B